MQLFDWLRVHSTDRPTIACGYFKQGMRNYIVPSQTDFFLIFTYIYITMPLTMFYFLFSPSI